MIGWSAVVVAEWLPCTLADGYVHHLFVDPLMGRDGNDGLHKGRAMQSLASAVAAAGRLPVNDVKVWY